MNYTQYALRVASMVPNPEVENIDFSVVLPATIDFAEQRIYRELDLLSTVVRDGSATFSFANRNLTLPTSLGTFVTVQSVNVVTPVGATPDTGTRYQLQPVSRDYLDSVWNSATGSTRPEYFAMIDNSHIIVGPWPDAGYTVEVIGTIRPTPISLSNPTTFLSLYLPDLFFAASMVFFSRAVLEFGAKVPGGPEYFESQYQALKASASAEELRKKFAGSDFTSSSTPVA